jgi:hypothetical protein
MVILMHEEAKRKLSDVPPDNNFRMKTGEEIKNLYELLKTLKNTSQENFSHHVNDEKNDFAQWIRHSVGDSELADKLMTVKDLETTKNIIEDRISFLKRRVDIGEVIKSIESFGNASTTEKMDGSTTAAVAEAEKTREIQPAQVQASLSALSQTSSAPLIEENKGSNAIDPALESLKASSSPISDAMGSIKNIPDNKEGINEDKTKTAHHEMHPFEHLKRNLHLIIVDVLVGFVLGMVFGFVLGHYAW